MILFDLIANNKKISTKNTIRLETLQVIDIDTDIGIDNKIPLPRLSAWQQKSFIKYKKSKISFIFINHNILLDVNETPYFNNKQCMCRIVTIMIDNNYIVTSNITIV